MLIEEKNELATLVLVCAITVAFVIVMHERNMHFVWRHGILMLVMTTGLIALSAFYRVIRPDTRIAHLTFALATQIWTACAVAGLTMAALGWHFPLIDAQLIATDHALGISTKGIITAFAHAPAFSEVLSLFYQISVGAIFASLIILTFLGRTDRVAELGFLFTSTIVLCAVIGIPFPAYGAFTALGIGPDIRNALPAHAGVYYMPAMLAYRSGAENAIDLTQLVGVITFPSFHTCMVLMVTWSFRRIRYLFWPVATLNAIVGLSIIPIGGHYATDIIGGIAVFVIAAAATNIICRLNLATSFKSDSRPDFPAIQVG